MKCRFFFFFSREISLPADDTLTDRNANTSGRTVTQHRGRNSATQTGWQKLINRSETGVENELWKQGDSSAEPEKYHMTEADGDWKVSQTLRHVSVLRWGQVSAEPACGRMHTEHVCVCVCTRKRNKHGKLTLSETSVIKIIDGLRNFPELQTNIGTKPSYSGSNNIHRWIQVANWCSAMLQGHDLENQNPAAVWKWVKGLGVARSSLIYQWIQIHISKLAGKSQLFEAF